MAWSEMLLHMGVAGRNARRNASDIGLKTGVMLSSLSVMLMACSVMLLHMGVMLMIRGVLLLVFIEVIVTVHYVNRW